jgi:nicotinate-nucleotide adenylyltransferase
MSVKRLGMLGGTFNPPHLAHLIAAELAVEAFALDRLLFIPANVPPHKVDHEIASAQDRLAMVSLATEGNSRFETSDIEISRNGKSYTIDTIHALHEVFQPEHIFLFIGLDNLAIFDTWHRSEEIFKQCEIIVMARPSHEIDTIDSKLRDRVKFMPIPLMEISSTNIRERVRDGKSIRYLVPESICSYIAEHNLYR